jgi:hypothetical protein
MIGAVLAKRGVAGGYNAMNRRDLPAMMADWHDDAVFVYPGDVPASGTFEGKSIIEDWFRRYFEQFPKVRFEVHDICVRDIFLLFANARRRCPEMTEPECMACPLDPVCAHRMEYFQPVLRTTFY